MRQAGWHGSAPCPAKHPGGRTLPPRPGPANNIDWLRVIAIFLVFVYHTPPFSSEGFHAERPRLCWGRYHHHDSPIWMPSSFLIPGPAFYALGKRSGGRYLGSVLRLVGSFIVGMVTYIPLLVIRARPARRLPGNPPIHGPHFDGLYARRDFA
jgi:hypothetical protein